jgi:hypothetical protein
VCGWRELFLILVLVFGAPATAVAAVVVVCLEGFVNENGWCDCCLCAGEMGGVWVFNKITDSHISVLIGEWAAVCWETVCVAMTEHSCAMRGYKLNDVLTGSFRGSAPERRSTRGATEYKDGVS